MQNCSEIDGGLDAKKIVVGGFSMGGALAIHSALTYPQRIGAVVALSGFLLQRDAIKAASLCLAKHFLFNVVYRRAHITWICPHFLVTVATTF